jgi:uncharacterized membrane protein
MTASTSASASASASARKAARSKPMAAVARMGFAARGCIYLLVGALAIALTFGDYGNEPDQQGALQTLTQHPGGVVLVWLITIGLFGYALWRLTQAAFGVVGEGRKIGPRLQALASGLIYLFFGFTAVRVAVGANAGSQAQRQQEWTGKVMQYAGGRWIIGIVGCVIVICGVALAVQGITRKFEDYLQTERMSRIQRRIVELLGIVGSIGRGVVFALAGLFVIIAAVTAKPDKARGLDQAFRKLLTMTGGPALVFVCGLGLVIFGLYGFAEAKWRKT